MRFKNIGYIFTIKRFDATFQSFHRKNTREGLYRKKYKCSHTQTHARVRARNISELSTYKRSKFYPKRNSFPFLSVSLSDSSIYIKEK